MDKAEVLAWPSAPFSDYCGGQEGNFFPLSKWVNFLFKKKAPMNILHIITNYSN